MKCSRSEGALAALVLLSVLSAINGGIVSYLDVLNRVSNVKSDLRTNLRTIRELAIQNGMIKQTNGSATSGSSSRGQLLMGIGDKPDSLPTVLGEGRKKEDSNDGIVKADGDEGDFVDFDLGESNENLDPAKKGRGRRKRLKRRGWRKAMKKALPIILVIMALKAVMLHFVLKALVLATGLSLLLSKKSLLVSLLIALKLMVSHPHSSDKSESNKLEVVHIPIRKETGFNKKIQLAKVRTKGKIKIIVTTPKPPGYKHYSTGHQIKHTHQQMADFGGKYIPLGYETNNYLFDVTTPTPSYLDALPETTDHDNYFDVNDLQFARRDGWDGWTGWNRGDNGDPYSAYDLDRQPSEYRSQNYEQDYPSINGHGGFNQANKWLTGDQPDYKQRNLSQMKYRRKPFESS
ncbi:uncharacterized protein LOC131435511 [Malaya genurostris]|uniref:uncharacterized protein LOC131435511 n=1 Tax=Malaya genurostris TaxID=325434 RepID=UPI0026F39FAD|nr:uncharacterized protein LOC131435511 [Malaya genurostris]